MTNGVHFATAQYFVIIIIIGPTALHEPWPSSKASFILPYLMPNSSNSSLLKS
jgi:hypothetical protein